MKAITPLCSSSNFKRALVSLVVPGKLALPTTVSRSRPTITTTSSSRTFLSLPDQHTAFDRDEPPTGSYSNVGGGDLTSKNCTYIVCEYEDKERVKSLGALFDGVRKQWYIPKNVPESGFVDYRLTRPHLYYYVDCPYEEKDQCKERGGMFDGGKRLWYFESEEVAIQNDCKWPGKGKIIYLDVPYEVKDEAKALGAKWDIKVRKWYTFEHLATQGIFDSYIPQEFGSPDEELDEYSDVGEITDTLVKEDLFDKDFLSDFHSSISLSSESSSIQSKDLTGKYIVFFDVETSGLPERGPLFGEAPPFRKTRAYDGCRMIQICAMLCKAECLTTVETKNLLIKATDFEISEGSYSVHGISKEKTLAEGIDLKDAIENEIYPLFAKANFMAAHNADFDSKVLQSELVRGKFDEFLEHFEKNMQVICTMKKTKKIVGAMGKLNRLKNPNLKELFEFATNKELEGHHDAMYDVINMHEAVKSLVDQGKLNLFGDDNEM